MRRVATAAVVLVAAASGFAASAAGAAAAFGLHDLSASPADASAGAHSTLSIHVGVSDSVDQVKDLTIHLPPGMVGNPTAPALCTVAKLGSDGCPASSKVGNVTAATTVWVLKPLVGVPLTVDGTIYNLAPQPGEPARFGIILRPPLSSLGVLPRITLQSAVELRRSDYGLDTVLRDIPNSVMGLAVDIQAMDITLLSHVGDEVPFMRNPTSCATATTRFDASSYSDPGTTVTGEASWAPTNCNKLAFSPRLSASVGSRGHTANGTKPPLTATISQGDDEAGVRDATVILPKGIGPDNAALSHSCPGEQFLAGACPQTTVLGSAVARSPLLSGPLQGPVILVSPPVAGQLPALGVDLHGQLNLQLFGSFVVTAAGPGNAFVGLPDIPLSRFALTFDADHLVLTTRDICAGPAPLFHADFSSQSGAQSSTDDAADLGGCGGSKPGGHHRPRARVKLSGIHTESPRLRLAARAGDVRLREATLRLPTGLRFAAGEAWRSGASGSGSVSHTARSVRVRSRGGGARRLALKVGGGALEIQGELPTSRLRFAVALRDRHGDTTRVVARVRPRG